MIRTLLASTVFLALAGTAAPLVAQPSSILPAVAVETTAKTGGGFEKASFSIDGSWTIEQRGDTRVLVLSEDFKTRSGPDLKVFFSPKRFDEVTGKTATEGSYYLAPLQSRRGAQEYELPADLDLAAFSSVLIHCEAYSKLWGGADL